MTIKQLWTKFIEGDKDGKETEFLPSILEVTETPPSPVGRLVLWTLVLLIVVLGIWAFVGEVDEVAVATGKVIPVGNVKIVQSGNKGAIKALYVKEGDFVEEGQPLVELDTTKTKADVDQVRKQVAYFGMTVDRLNAEMNDTAFALPAESPDLDAKDVQAQQSLYTSRRAQLLAQMDRADAMIVQEEAAIRSAEAQRQKYIAMLNVAVDKEQRLETLYQSDAVSYFQLIEARATRIEYQKTADAIVEDIAKENGKLAEAREQKASVIADYRKDTMTQLVDAKKQYNGYAEELKKAEDTNQKSVIYAPVSGRVNQLAIHTLGGVVTEAQALMMIVPDDVVMEFEVYADNKDIGYIKNGQKAEVKVETFDFQKHGMVNAEVDEISPDAVADQNDKQHNGKYRLALMQVEDNDSIRLVPGMNVTAEVKIKKKRIIDFFLDPFRKYKDEALRER